MEYTGLAVKYRVNRALSRQERDARLDPAVRLNVEPAYELSVIRFNASFIELVDKYHAWKGFLTIFLIAAMAVVGGGCLLLAGSLAREAWTFAPDAEGAAAYAAVMLLIAAAVIAPGVWLLRKESFAYTHYPIRLNRKTRMVHVFRLDGSVLSVPWDEVFFCLGPLPQRSWEIQGHVLDADRQTVRETFAFAPHGVGTREREMLKQYWEFVRRYMEDGPQAVANDVKVLLPIADRRETFAFGWHRTHYHAGSLPVVMQVLMLLLYLLIYPGRWFALRTSRIPRWPAAVEDAPRSGLTPADAAAASLES